MVLESSSLSDLRSTIREAIARGIVLVLDQERFLHRVTDVIAESTGNPLVAAYVAEAYGDGLILGASTTAAPAWLPKRLPATAIPFTQTQVVESAEVFGAREELTGDSSVVMPLILGDELIGAVIVLDVVPEGLTSDDLEAFAVVAEEIAPAVSVANAHETALNSIVRDLDTGAYNYAFFSDRLEQEISRAQRTGHSVTIVLVEALDFETFEASAGYELADKTLRDLASGFTDLMRTSDVVARRGRTGFALLLPDSNVAGADVTIERVVRLVSQVDSALEANGYNGPKPGVITGSATFPADGDTTAALVLAADQRLLASDTASPAPGNE